MVMRGMPSRLEDLARKARSLLGTFNSTFDGTRVTTVEDVLRTEISAEQDLEKSRVLGELLKAFQAYFSALPPAGPEGDAVVISEEEFAAYLTLVPARGGPRGVGSAKVVGELKARGIVGNLDLPAIEAACGRFAQEGQFIYALKVAAGVPPEDGVDASISLRVKAFDKRILTDPDSSFLGDLAAMVEVAKPGWVVAVFTPPTPGNLGVTVKGQEVLPVPGRVLAVEGFGNGVLLSPNGRVLYSLVTGTLVAAERSMDVVPFHLLEGGLEAGRNIEFEGNVLVTGHAEGPVSVHGADVYIAGNAENVTVLCEGDVWIGGKFSRGRIRAGGGVHARVLEGTVVQAIGDVAVRGAIVESEVTSDRRVVVSGKPGEIAGGAVAALKELVVQNVRPGSGPPTLRVGQALLSQLRSISAEGRIKELTGALARMHPVRSKLAPESVEALKLPAERLDLYVGLAKKEAHILEEVRALLVRQASPPAATEVHRDGFIRVMGSLEPPAIVSVAGIPRRVEERMERVTFSLNGGDSVRDRKEVR